MGEGFGVGAGLGGELCAVAFALSKRSEKVSAARLFLIMCSPLSGLARDHATTELV